MILRCVPKHGRYRRAHGHSEPSPSIPSPLTLGRDWAQNGVGCAAGAARRVSALGDMATSSSIPLHG